MVRLNQLTRITQMIQSNQSIKSIYMLKTFDFVHLFWKIFDFVDLYMIFNQLNSLNHYQSLKVNRLNHVLYENELNHQSTHFNKELNQFSHFWGKWINSNQSTHSSCLVYKSTYQRSHYAVVSCRRRPTTDAADTTCRQWTDRARNSDT